VAGKAVADMKVLVDSPEAIIVATGGDNPVFLVHALKSAGLLKPGVALIGTDRWLEHPVDDPLLQGAYVAGLDPDEKGPIADRFQGRFGYNADLSVAYAYDMVALVSGIASALGPEGFKRTTFETRTGFRGSTGVFRFRSDGGSERSMHFYRIEKSKLKQIEKSVSGF